MTGAISDFRLVKSQFVPIILKELYSKKELTKCLEAIAVICHTPFM